MGKEIRYEKVEADEWALFHRVRVKFDGTWIRCNGSERECFVPWKATAKRSDKIKQALKALDADAAADLGAAKLLRELGMFDEKEINERIN